MNAQGLKVHNFLLFCCAMLLLFFGTDMRAGNMFVSDFSASNIYEFTPAGAQSTFASGFNGPYGLAFNCAGILFEADWGSGNIYKILPNGTKSIFASGFNEPDGLAFDSTGNLFVASNANGLITKIATNGTQTVFASGLTSPYGLAFDGAGNLYVANTSDISGNVVGNVFKYTPGGTKSTTMSGGSPVALAFDGSGNLFVANALSNSITEITTTGVQSNYATLYNPWGLAFDGNSNLFVVDGNGGKVIKITPGGVQSTNVSGLSSPLAMAFQPSPKLHPTMNNNTKFVLAVSMPSPYYSAVVQASTNLVSWSPIVTNIPPFNYTDSVMTASRRFYRVLLGP